MFLRRWEKLNKLNSKIIALQFVNHYFSECQGAILAGSVVRGEANSTSDLDIVIFDSTLPSAYRESLFFENWPIEVFVHNLHSYKEFFASDCERAKPTLPRMVAEGIVLKDEGIMEDICSEARSLLSNGPVPWSLETIYMKRYFLTDMLDDFIGNTCRAEEIFIAGTLADLTGEFILRTNRQWLGHGKWLVRSLKLYDEKLANKFANAFQCFYETGQKEEVIELVESALQPHGGRLFEGFSVKKN